MKSKVSGFYASFEKAYATKQKKRKESRFLDFEKNVKVITCKVLETT